MFGDNQSVVGSSTMINAKLHKRHTALSFHRVREAIASGVCGFFHIPGHLNPADIMSKNWAYNAVWKQLLRPLLFYAGNTGKLLDEPTGTLVQGQDGKEQTEGKAGTIVPTAVDGEYQNSSSVRHDDGSALGLPKGRHVNSTVKQAVDMDQNGTRY